MRTFQQHCALLFLIAVIAWIPLIQAGFIWDDDTLVTQNPMVLSPKGIYQCWISLDTPDYLPLTISSLWIEWRLWGNNASGYHITNVLIHLFTCIIIACIFQRLNWPGGWIAAILYAIHPVNVESVAWIAQRKNVLCIFFTVLSIYSFVRANQENRNNVHSFVFFICALLSKAAAIMLPFWLILLLYFQFKQALQKAMIQLVPFLIAAGIFSGITLFFQYENAMGRIAVRTDNLIERCLFAFQAFLFYLSKVFFPKTLCFVYWIKPDPFQMIMGCSLFFTFIALLYRMRRQPWSRAGILAFSFYVLNLFPVLGFFDIYFMRFSWVADHWQSLSMIGITSGAGAFLGWIIEQSKNKPVIPYAFCKKEYDCISSRRSFLFMTSGYQTLFHKTCQVMLILLIILLAATTHDHCKYYQSEQALWEKTLKCNPRSILPHDRMALIAVASNHYEQAEHYLKTSISIDPNNWEAHMNMGNLYRRMKLNEKAEKQYMAALSIHPSGTEIHINLGNFKAEKGQYTEALNHYKDAVDHGANNAYVHYQLGMAYLQADNAKQALYHFQTTISHDSNTILAHFYAGKLLANTRPFEAIRHLERCVQMNQIQHETHFILGEIYARLCRCTQAKLHYKQAGKWVEQDITKFNTHCAPCKEL
ncbi:MAG: tetratricopeptide repeat protein [Candidatus Magnetomorum sp.]|nr:tetratricopeptide repeat protein [Candidatus Magnetomorum sp.]